MTEIDFNGHLKQVFEQMRALRNSKGKEYSGNTDVLANFKRVGAAYGISPLIVCAIFLEKHLDGIRSYVRLGKTLSSESVEGCIRDAQLYLALLEALIMEQEPANCTGVHFVEDCVNYESIARSVFDAVQQKQKVTF